MSNPYKTVLDSALDSEYSKEDIASDVEALLDASKRLGEKFNDNQEFHAELLQLMERGHRLLNSYGPPEEYESENDDNHQENEEVPNIGKFAVFSKEDISHTPNRFAVPAMSWRATYESFDEAVEDVKGLTELNESLYIGTLYYNEDELLTNIVYERTPLDNQ